MSAISQDGGWMGWDGMLRFIYTCGHPWCYAINSSLTHSHRLTWLWGVNVPWCCAIRSSLTYSHILDLSIEQGVRVCCWEKTAALTWKKNRCIGGSTSDDRRWEPKKLQHKSHCRYGILPPLNTDHVANKNAARKLQRFAEPSHLVWAIPWRALAEAGPWGGYIYHSVP